MKILKIIQNTACKIYSARIRLSLALKVTGDSIIDANIHPGDIVIVNRQEVVSNNDIVIALISEEATMKKYMLMGNTVLLISENPNYESIQMYAENVQINGKVIGVLKMGVRFSFWLNRH